LVESLGEVVVVDVPEFLAFVESHFTDVPLLSRWTLTPGVWVVSRSIPL
jgi:hypothetical protein